MALDLRKEFNLDNQDTGINIAEQEAPQEKRQPLNLRKEFNLDTPITGGVSKDRKKPSYYLAKGAQAISKPFVNTANVLSNSFKTRGDRFIDMPANALKDGGEIVMGMAQMLGQGVNTGVFQPAVRLATGQVSPQFEQMTNDNIKNELVRNILNRTVGTIVTDNGLNFGNAVANDVQNLGKITQTTPDGKNAYRLQLRENHPELFGLKDVMLEGVKEQYGQSGKSLMNGEFDLGSFGHSFVRHPLMNGLDVLGLGDVGSVAKAGSLANKARLAKMAKGEKVFAKIIGNETLLPNYSDNLIIQAAQRLAETNPVQKIVEYADNSPLTRPFMKGAASFTGAGSDSRLLGKNVSEQIRLKELEKKSDLETRQNIYNRDKEIEEKFGDISDEDGVKIVQEIEGGKDTSSPVPVPKNTPLNNIDEVKTRVEELNNAILNRDLSEAERADIIRRRNKLQKFLNDNEAREIKKQAQTVNPQVQQAIQQAKDNQPKSIIDEAVSKVNEQKPLPQPVEPTVPKEPSLQDLKNKLAYVNRQLAQGNKAERAKALRKEQADLKTQIANWDKNHKVNPNELENINNKAEQVTPEPKNIEPQDKSSKGIKDNSIQPKNTEVEDVKTFKQGLDWLIRNSEDYAKRAKLILTDDIEYYRQLKSEINLEHNTLPKMVDRFIEKHGLEKSAELLYKKTDYSFKRLADKLKDFRDFRTNNMDDFVKSLKEYSSISDIPEVQEVLKSLPDNISVGNLDDFVNEKKTITFGLAQRSKNKIFLERRRFQRFDEEYINSRNYILESAVHELTHKAIDNNPELAKKYRYNKLGVTAEEAISAFEKYYKEHIVGKNPSQDEIIKAVFLKKQHKQHPEEVFAREIAKKVKDCYNKDKFQDKYINRRLLNEKEKSFRNSQLSQGTQKINGSRNADNATISRFDRASDRFNDTNGSQKDGGDFGSFGNTDGTNKFAEFDDKWSQNERNNDIGGRLQRKSEEKSDKNNVARARSRENPRREISSRISETTEGVFREQKQSFKDFLKENSDFYKKKGLLKEEQEQTNILNTYVSYKTGKTKVSDITDAERQQALTDINKLPDEDKPFYVPRIYEENLSVSQNKILGKDFDPKDIGELKKRKHVGASRTINDGRLTRVFSPKQIAKQLSDHRARLECTEGYIDSVTKSFAKPIKDGKVEKGYVPYNPEAIKATFLDNTSLAKDTIDGLNEGHPYSQALNRALSKCAPEIRKSVEEAMEAVKTDATMQIPENVMKELIKNSDKGTTNAGLAIWDIGTNAFKTNVLGLNAKWFINNRIGNAIMGGMKGVNLLNPTNISKINKLADDLFPESISGSTFMSNERVKKLPKTGDKVFDDTMSLLSGNSIKTRKINSIDDLSKDEIAKLHSDIYKRTGNKKISNKDIVDEARKIYRGENAKATALNVLSAPAKVVNKISKAMFDLNQKFETMDRKTAYLHALNKEKKNILKATGKKMITTKEMLEYAKGNAELTEKLLKQVDNILGDYSTMSKTERNVIRRVLPFYTWIRVISRHTMSLPETNPIRTSLVSKLSAYTMDDNEELPEYQKGSVDTGLKSRNRKNIRLNYEHSVPYSTFSDLSNPINSASPIIKNAIEATTGRKIYNGMPLTSKNYDANFAGGYSQIDVPEEEQKKVVDLPASKRAKAFAINTVRDTIPGVKQTERVLGGIISNSKKNGKLTLGPYDNLYDTDFGGYMKQDLYKKKGWRGREQLMRYIFPMQEEGHITKKKNLSKRQKEYNREQIRKQAEDAAKKITNKK